MLFRSSAGQVAIAKAIIQELKSRGEDTTDLEATLIGLVRILKVTTERAASAADKVAARARAK